jgi:glyoxylase-like metal-dependent hydrolase (beta-lactamase superfamily II)/rhodanese-related sulfurtransferase
LTLARGCGYGERRGEIDFVNGDGAAWTARDLKDRLDRGEDPFVLDVRAREDAAAFRLEGPRPLATVSAPYFEILESGNRDDVADAVVAYAEGELAGKLPRERTILTVCAKGGTSALVAEGLRRLSYRVANLEGGMAAWGDHYDVRALAAGAGRAIWQVSRPARGCVSYVVASGASAAVIDPLRHTAPYLELARALGLEIELVLDTHAHADHVSGGPALARASGARYHLHPYDAIHPMDLLPATIAYEPLRDGQVFALGRARIEALHVPGHTLGATAFLLDGELLFAGDTIFKTSVSRPDLGGRGEAWAPLHWRSLGRLLALPDATRVLPAHASAPAEEDEAGLFAAPLGALRASNAGLREAARGEDAFVRWVLASLPVFPPAYVEMKRVNLGLAAADDERASELEIGRNVCALAR